MVKPVVGAAVDLRSWLAKRQLRKLSGRDDLRHGLKLPYDVDPITEMTAIRDQRLGRGTRRK